MARAVRARPLSVAAVTCLAAACASDSAPPGVTVTDSAGITITLSPDVGATYAVVDPEPVLTLGGPNAVGAEQFYQVDGVVQNRDAIWVADGQSGEIRVFSADGAYRITLGGRGDGPGEFSRIRLLGTFAGDSVAAFDQANGRLTVYDATGESMRTARLEPGDEALPRPWDVYPDGSVLAQVPQVLMAAALQDGEVFGAAVRLVRFDLDDGTQTDVAGAEGRLWLWTGRAQLPIPFMENAAFELHGYELHLTAGPAFRIRVFEDGRVTRIYGVDRPERPVTEEDVQGYRDFIEEFYPEDQVAELIALTDHPATPDVLPAYRGMLVAPEGPVWAQRYVPETRWDVFGEGGELLGEVETPEDFFVSSIRGDRLAGVWRDDLGVEYVQVYRWRRLP